LFYGELRFGKGIIGCSSLDKEIYFTIKPIDWLIIGGSNPYMSTFEDYLLFDSVSDSKDIDTISDLSDSVLASGEGNF
jgi:hypothetical protein